MENHDCKYSRVWRIEKGPLYFSGKNGPGKHARIEILHQTSILANKSFLFGRSECCAGPFLFFNKIYISYIMLSILTLLFLEDISNFFRLKKFKVILIEKFTIKIDLF